MYLRIVDRQLQAALEDTPVIFLAGARQTGKSTLAQTLRPSGDYFTFDDLTSLGSARADPEGFVAALGKRVVLDEIQRAPELLLPIKAAVDRNRRPGRFVLTGSANVLVLPGVSESLAGRMEVLTLWPLAQAELDGVTPHFIDGCFRGRPEKLELVPLERRELIMRVLRGGYPEVVARKSHDAQRRWFDAYLTTVLQRDLRDLAAIEGLAQVPRLLQTLATRAGSPLNIADLGRTLGMNQMTLKRYLVLIEMLFLTVPLPPWFENLGKRLAKTPKLYLNDSGLLAHLLGLDAEGLAEDATRLGPILENFAVMELMKTAPAAKARPSLHHFRTTAGHEVDVVLESRKRELVGIEIKASATIAASDFRGLQELKSLVGARLKCGVVLYAGKKVLPFGPGLWAMPVEALWAEAA
jgi:predicted AAA+ superfamily ATPase